MAKKSKKSKEPKELIPWDPAFKELHQAILTYWHLQMIADVKLGKLHLKADMAIITPNQGFQKWKKHPLWKYVSHQNIVEFKSITDQLLRGDFEQLLAYTLLYRIKFKISYRHQLSAWLILPAITPTLRKALKHYRVELEPLYERTPFCQSEALHEIEQNSTRANPRCDKIRRGYSIETL